MRSLVLYRSFVTALLMLSAAGCGEDECADADAKLRDECGWTEEQLNKPEGCNDLAACEADCMRAPSCDEINAAISGEENAVSTCLIECQ